MLILAIDTAGPNCAVALGRRGEDGVGILARIEERIGTGHAERLMPMIEEALAAASLSYAELNRIAVATGPGSFTGVRIGIAAARGLSLALPVPAIGIGVLDAMIHEAREADAIAATIVACLDARRGEIYAKISGEPDAIRTDAAALAAQLAECDGSIVLVGSAADAVAAEPALAGRSLDILSRADCADIGILARLGAEAAEGLAPSPLYLRPPDAKPQTGRAVARL